MKALYNMTGSELLAEVRVQRKAGNRERVKLLCECLRLMVRMQRGLRCPAPKGET